MSQSDFRIIRNAGGVPGLMVALNAFTEDVEQRLFEEQSLYLSEFRLDPRDKKKRRSLPTLPMSWSQDVFSLCNLVSDSGLWSDYFTPDYCLGLTYPPGASFQSHFDSRHRWGETVVGVTLGQAGTMYFTPATKGKEEEKEKENIYSEIQENFVNDLGKPAIRVKHYSQGKYAIELDLPRRSIYVMTGAARVAYKHGLRTQQSANFASPPHWNPSNFRRCLTLRHTKCFSDICLELAIAKDPTNLSLIQRQKEQNKYVPKTEDSKPFKKKDLLVWKMYLMTIYDEMKYGRLSEIVKCRFPVNDTPSLFNIKQKRNECLTPVGPIVYDLTVDESDDECL